MVCFCFIPFFLYILEIWRFSVLSRILILLFLLGFFILALFFSIQRYLLKGITRNLSFIE
jgi:hypothetical protein